jgi:CDP-diacylglycerol--glycerol-3-phosphate 3-phosphatidyltransferase/cardiolipin synthase
LKLNLPLYLTLARVAVIPIVAGLFYVNGDNSVAARHWATVLFAAASITDWFDGYLARKWNQTTRFGAFLDPVADKLLVAIVLVLLVQDDPTRLLAGAAAVIIGREITISALREWLAEMGERTTVAVSWIGKVKTGFQMTAIGFLTWRTDTWFLAHVYEIGLLLLVIAAILTVWSMVVYLRAAWPIILKADQLDDV